MYSSKPQGIRRGSQISSQASYAAIFGIDENSLLENQRRLHRADLALRLALAQGRQQQSRRPDPTTPTPPITTAPPGITIIDNPGEKRPISSTPTPTTILREHQRPCRCQPPTASPTWPPDTRICVGTWAGA